MISNGCTAEQGDDAVRSAGKGNNEADKFDKMGQDKDEKNVVIEATLRFTTRQCLLS